jgi:hypothetical protein
MGKEDRRLWRLTIEELNNDQLQRAIKLIVNELGFSFTVALAEVEPEPTPLVSLDVFLPRVEKKRPSVIERDEKAVPMPALVEAMDEINENHTLVVKAFNALLRAGYADREFLYSEIAALMYKAENASDFVTDLWELNEQRKREAAEDESLNPIIYDHHARGMGDKTYKLIHDALVKMFGKQK